MPVTISGTSGLVLQYKYAVNNTAYSVSASTNASATGLSVSITPSSTSSKFLVITSIDVGYSSAGGTIVFNIARNGSSLNTTSAGSNYNGAGGTIFSNTLNTTNCSFSIIDSPNTSSAITYNVIYSNDGNMLIGRRSADTFLGVSQSIIVLELAQ